jgi:hypothetical protein
MTVPNATVIAPANAIRAAAHSDTTARTADSDAAPWTAGHPAPIIHWC